MPVRNGCYRPEHLYTRIEWFATYVGPSSVIRFQLNDKWRLQWGLR
jgi:hypothetical protein